MSRFAIILGSMISGFRVEGVKVCNYLSFDDIWF